MAVDKHLYARSLLQALMHGEDRIGPDWHKDLTVPGYVVTDAKPLHDHLTTTGSLPAERATVMDLLAAKDLVEQDHEVGTHSASIRRPSHEEHGM